MDRAITIFADGEALSRRAAEAVVAVGQAAITERGEFSLVLSGGRTPKRLYELLASDFAGSLDWTHVRLFWGDERYVPHDDEASCYRMAREALISQVPVEPFHVHAIPTHHGDPEASAAEYAETLARYFAGDPPVFDMVLLGMGADGHCASLFPGDPNSGERERWVIPGRAPVEPVQRLSMTLPLLTQARQTLFLVTGADKRPVLTEIFENPTAKGYAAGRVDAEGRNVRWYIDEAAKPEL